MVLAVILNRLKLRWCGVNLEIMMVGCSFRPFKIMMVGRHFELSKITIVGRNFRPSKITIVGVILDCYELHLRVKTLTVQN